MTESPDWRIFHTENWRQHKLIYGGKKLLGSCSSMGPKEAGSDLKGTWEWGVKMQSLSQQGRHTPAKMYQTPGLGVHNFLCDVTAQKD